MSDLKKEIERMLTELNEQKKNFDITGAPIPLAFIFQIRQLEHLQTFSISNTEEVKATKDWIEDTQHENGDYENVCVECKSKFIGHKRRVICKECSKSEPSPVSVDVEEIAKSNAEQCFLWMDGSDEDCHKDIILRQMKQAILEATSNCRKELSVKHHLLNERIERVFELNETISQLRKEKAEMFTDSYNLAMLCLQSDRYKTDAEYRQAVDNVFAQLKSQRRTKQ